MNREETLACIKVMLHYVDGGAVECWEAGEWVPITSPDWNWVGTDYRINIKKTSKKIKLEAWIDHSGQLGWHTADSILNEYIDDRWRRVPSEDKWVEVEE